jgi:hypothetical protein
LSIERISTCLRRDKLQRKRPVLFGTGLYKSWR